MYHSVLMRRVVPFNGGVGSSPPSRDFYIDDFETTSDSDSVSEQGISSANIHSCTDCGRPSIACSWVEKIERGWFLYQVDHSGVTLQHPLLTQFVIIVSVRTHCPRVSSRCISNFFSIILHELPGPKSQHNQGESRSFRILSRIINDNIK